jgi:hypothetical protein
LQHPDLQFAPGIGIRRSLTPIVPYAFFACICDNFIFSNSDTVGSWRSGDRKGCGDEIFSTRPDRPWGSSNPLYVEHRVSLRWVKKPGRGFDHPPFSSVEVKENAKLYLYSPCGPTWSVLGRILL